MFTSTYRTKKIEDSGVFVGTVNIFWTKRFVWIVEVESSEPDSLVLAYLLFDLEKKFRLCNTANCFFPLIIASFCSQKPFHNQSRCKQQRIKQKCLSFNWTADKFGARLSSFSFTRLLQSREPGNALSYHEVEIK